MYAIDKVRVLTSMREATPILRTCFFLSQLQEYTIISSTTSIYTHECSMIQASTPIDSHVLIELPPKICFVCFGKMIPHHFPTIYTRPTYFPPFPTIPKTQKWHFFEVAYFTRSLNVFMRSFFQNSTL